MVIKPVNTKIGAIMARDCSVRDVNIATGTMAMTEAITPLMTAWTLAKIALSKLALDRPRANTAIMKDKLTKTSMKINNIERARNIVLLLPIQGLLTSVDNQLLLNSVTLILVAL